jgi:hypothetical protein
VARLNLMLKALTTRDGLPKLQNIVHSDSLRLDWAQAFPQVFDPLPASPVRNSIRTGEEPGSPPPLLNASVSPMSGASRQWAAGRRSTGEGRGGGFDIIIGNPPYVRAENMPRGERDYYISSDRFESAYGRFDIHILFVEQAIKTLKEGGRLGFIIPYAGLSQNYGLKMRTLILTTCVVETIVDLTGYKVFEDASIATCIIILRKEPDASKRIHNQIQVIRQATYDSGIHGESKHAILQGVFHETPLSTFRLDLDAATVDLVKKIESQSFKLGDICYLITGALSIRVIEKAKSEFFAPLAG